MKIVRSFISVVLITCSALSALCGGGIPGVGIPGTFSVTIDGCTWSYEISGYADPISYKANATAHICGVSPATGAIEIPSVISHNDTEYSVTSIEADAFSGCSGLTGVKIPNTVNRIARNAFSGCDAALFDTNSIPGAKLVDGWLLDHDGTLTGDLKLSGIRGVGNSMFANFAGLTSVTLSDTVTCIGDDAFYGCSNLTSVTMCNSVTNIGHWAFDGCSNLKSVTMMGDCPTVGWYAFDGVPADCVVYLPLGNETYVVAGKWQGMKVEYWGGNLTIVDGMVTGCSLNGATKVIIPDGVTSIGDYAFEYCSSMTSVKLPDSVVCIGLGAFSHCSGMTSVTIPDSVTSIGADAFLMCSGLTNLMMSGSLTSIGDYAFNGCSGLTSVTIPDSVMDIGYYAFSSCTGLTSLTIGNGVTSIGACAFAGCKGLTSVIIPDSVTSIGNYMFRNCSGLTSVTIPDSVRSIGDWAFDGCCALTSVIIPDRVTSIGDNAFSGCTNLVVNLECPCPDNYASSGIMDALMISFPTNMVFYETYEISNHASALSSWAETALYIDALGMLQVTGSYYDSQTFTEWYSYLEGWVDRIGEEFSLCLRIAGDNGEYEIPVSRDNISTSHFGCWTIHVPCPLDAVCAGPSSVSIGLVSRIYPGILLPDDQWSWSPIIQIAWGNIVNGSQTVLHPGDIVAFEGPSGYYYYGGLDVIEGFEIDDLWNVYNGYMDIMGTCHNGVYYWHVPSANDSVYYYNGVTSLSTLDTAAPYRRYWVHAGCSYGQWKQYTADITYEILPEVETRVATFALGQHSEGETSLVQRKERYTTIQDPWVSTWETIVFTNFSYQGYGASCVDSHYPGWSIDNGWRFIGWKLVSGCVKPDYSSQAISLGTVLPSVDGLYVEDDCVFEAQYEATFKYSTLEDGSLCITGHGGICPVDIVVPESHNGIQIRAIADYAFSDQTSLGSVQLPETVTSIGESAFSGCTNLTQIYMTDAVTSIGDSAFYNCNALSDIVFSANVGFIGENAFYGCENAREIRFAAVNEVVHELPHIEGCGLHKGWYTEAVGGEKLVPQEGMVESGKLYYARYATPVSATLSIPDSITVGDEYYSSVCAEVSSSGGAKTWNDIVVSVYDQDGEEIPYDFCSIEILSDRIQYIDYPDVFYYEGIDAYYPKAGTYSVRACVAAESPVVVSAFTIHKMVYYSHYAYPETIEGGFLWDMEYSSVQTCNSYDSTIRFDGELGDCRTNCLKITTYYDENPSFGSLPIVYVKLNGHEALEGVDYVVYTAGTGFTDSKRNTYVCFLNGGLYDVSMEVPGWSWEDDWCYEYLNTFTADIKYNVAPKDISMFENEHCVTNVVYTGSVIQMSEMYFGIVGALVRKYSTSVYYLDPSWASINYPCVGTFFEATDAGEYKFQIGAEFSRASDPQYDCYSHPSVSVPDVVDWTMLPYEVCSDDGFIGYTYCVNYTGVCDVVCRILPRPVVAAQAEFVLPENLAYDGCEKVLAGLTITNDYNGAVLQEGVDYDVYYSDNVNPGTATVTVTCKGNYSGTFTKTFEIANADFGLVTEGESGGFSGEAGTIAGYEGIYDGEGHGLAVDVSAVGYVGVRYALSQEGPYVDSLLLTNVCDQTVWVELSALNYNSFTGFAQVVISPKSIEGCGIEVESPVAYDGHAMQSAVSVVDDDLGTSLVRGEDYELEYSENDVVGAAGVKVVGIGNYKDEVDRTFEVVKGTIRINDESTWQWIGADGFAFDGTNKTVAFASDGAVPNEVVDVEITGVTNAVHAGTYTAYANGTITGFKTDDFYNYYYTTVLYNVACAWQIRPRSCDNCDASLSPGVMFHTGGGLEPEITVVDGGLGTTLARGVDYELNFRNNVNIGTAEVEVRFIGDYCGSKTLNFHVIDIMVNLPKVRITPQSGIYEGRTGITLNYDGVEGVDFVVRYTLDGSDPTAESTVYSGKFATIITGETWLKVAAFSGDVRISEISVSHIYPTIASIILEDGSDPVEFTNEKPLQWVLDDTVSGLDGRSAMRSSADVSDNGESVLAATFNGKGILMFKWKTSCEVDEPGYYYFDHAVCVADGEEVAWLDGITEWLDVSLTFEDEGEHTVVWKYVKDDADDGEYPGEDCAWLGMVSWTSTSAITLTFDAGDGSVEEGERMMRLNDPVGELPVPVWAHHDFAGWWTAGGVQVEAGARLYEDTALYAHWTLSRYVVSFDPNGGEVEAEDRHIEYGSAIGELPVPTWEGREFLGWFTAVDGGDAVSSETEVLDEVVLFARWCKLTFMVSFDANGGEMEADDRQIEYGATIGELPVPTWEGREFLGWFTAADGGEQVDEELQITDAVSLFAHWRKYTFTVSFDANGGEVEADDRVVEYGDTIGELPMPEYEHMEFLGWYTSAGARVAEDTVVTEDMPLRAEWRYAFSFGDDGVWNDIGEGVWQSGETSDSSTNSVSMEAHGEGTISFRWKVSCEDPVVIKDVIYRMDYLSFAIDGVERTCIYGTTDWASISFEVVGLGSHEFEWLYVKDSATSEGEDCGWIGEVVWTPRGPAIEGDDEATVEGDATSGYTVKPSEGNKDVVVTIPEGVDSERVTVEVSAEVETVTANGANVRVMKGEHDIAEHLDLEAVTQDGVINLAEAKVRDEVAKEALDTEKGAEIDISDPESPELTTAETKPGLTYTLREGATLEDMKDGDSKLGDGKKWTPNITVKGGASGFYTIKVEK